MNNKNAKPRKACNGKFKNQERKKMKRTERIQLDNVSDLVDHKTERETETGKSISRALGEKFLTE